VLFGTDFGFDSTFAEETMHDIETIITDESLKQDDHERNARRILQFAHAA
jgi:hypothetical protein